MQEVILDQKDVESGRIPRTIECELTEDLTGSCSPGDLITVNGIVKALTAESSGAGRSNKDKCTFVLYVNVNSMQGMLSSDNEDASANKFVNNAKNFEFTASDLECFKEIKSQPDVFKYF